MRREGFELQVSAPQVIMKEVDGHKQEPIEHVAITVSDDLAGTVIQMLADRKGMMTNMFSEHGMTNLEFEVPTRGLLGFRAAFILMTKGEGLMTSSFAHYAPYMGHIPKRTNGSMISGFNGKSMKYSIWKLQERGVIFTQPAMELYEGMIVGESAKPGDLMINITKNKQQSNMRTGKNDENMDLKPIKDISLEDALSYIGTDEYVEVTPKNIRMRKIHLRESDRKNTSKN